MTGNVAASNKKKVVRIPVDEVYVDHIEEHIRREIESDFEPEGHHPLHVLPRIATVSVILLIGWAVYCFEFKLPSRSGVYAQKQIITEETVKKDGESRQNNTETSPKKIWTE